MKEHHGTSLLKHFRKVKGQAGYFEGVHKGKDPSSFIVLFEDSAALLGLFVALIGVFLSETTGNEIYDGLASILIGCILGVTASWLAYETKGLLIGERASEDIIKGVKNILSTYSRIKNINEVLTMHMGPDFILVNLSVDFQNDITAADTEEIISDIDTKLKQKFSAIKKVFIEAEAIKKKK